MQCSFTRYAYHHQQEDNPSNQRISKHRYHYFTLFDDSGFSVLIIVSTLNKKGKR